MSLKAAVVVGLVVAACAGCATGNWSRAGSGTNGSIEGQASPSMGDNRAWDYRFGGPCESGADYNWASGLCVSPGGE